MTESPDFHQLEHVVHRIDANSKLVRSWELKGGISAQMTALEVLLADGQTQKMILRYPGDSKLKQDRQAAAHQYRLLQIMQDSGLATPRPYYVDDSREIFSTPYLVIEYIEGTPEFAPLNLPDFVGQIATQLAAIHHLNNAALDLSFLEASNSITERLSRRPESATPFAEEGHIRAALASAGDLRPLNAPVLLHGDFWPGNLLWHEGRLVGVVDWEDAALGDALNDLANSRLDILMMFGITAMNDFTQRYLSLTAFDFTHLPYWDLYAALRAGPNLAEWAAVYAPLGRHDINEQTMREALAVFIAQALEKVAD